MEIKDDRIGASKGNDLNIKGLREPLEKSDEVLKYLFESRKGFLHVGYMKANVKQKRLILLSYRLFNVLRISS